MQKSSTAFRTISEVGETLGVQAHVLRFWESKFTQIKPVKRGGGRRYYRPDDIALIRAIQHLLHEQGMTIKGAQKIIYERGVKAVVAMGTDLLASNTPATDIAEPEKSPQAAMQLISIYTKLTALRASITAQISELA